MEQKIGDTAGKIWRELRKKGEMAISQVPKSVKEKDTVSYLAMGWLAREGKIGFQTKGNRTSVFIRE